MKEDLEKLLEKAKNFRWGNYIEPEYSDFFLSFLINPLIKEAYELGKEKGWQQDLEDKCRNEFGEGLLVEFDLEKGKCITKAIEQFTPAIHGLARRDRDEK